MKKYISFIVLLMLMLALTACGEMNKRQMIENEIGIGKSESISETNKEANKVVDATSKSNEKNESATKEEYENKILIAYFSWSGTTKKLAEMIQTQTGGELFKIETIKPYSTDYNKVLNEAQNERKENARPKLTNRIEKFNDYDVIFVGYPIWWGDTPMAIKTFFEEYNFNGKKIIPFCTYDSSGTSGTFSEVKKSVSGAKVLDGFGVSKHDLDGADKKLSEWIKKLVIAN